MPLSPPRWTVITESPYPWEREALEFVRQRLPDHEPYRAWANFEFIADDGSINEVDLLVLTPKGFFLVEIKSWPGEIRGDASTWIWTPPDGHVSTRDNPLLLTNRKAKKLVGLLRRQKSAKKAGVPFLDGRVFLSAENLVCGLSRQLMDRVHLRDRAPSDNEKERPGIISALTRWAAGASDDPGNRRIDRPMAKAISRALEEAGIRPSQKARRIGDYLLKELIHEGPGYQDWLADHAALKGSQARVRLYPIELGSGEIEREMRQRAAEREFKMLQGITHASILRAVGFTMHERGPALVFEHDPKAQRLDHFLRERGAELTIDARLHLLRQLGEVLRYAHEKKLVHRALGPQSVLVVDPDASNLSLRVFNWQTGLRAAGTHSSRSSVTGTAHPEQLVEDSSLLYMAPEVIAGGGDATAEAADVFSLGAIGFHLFAGVPPASTLVERDEQLREQRGLDVAAVMDGAGQALRKLIRESTCPDVGGRLDSAQWFLQELEEVEAELTTPDEDVVTDPREAKAGDVLPGGFRVINRLGRGSSATAFVVERGGKEMVLKIAASPDHDERLRAEAEILRKIRHQHVVEILGEVEVGDRAGILMERAGEGTLAQRLRREGRIQPELLQRFGEDLLGVADWLEQQGIAHRDIKPDNIGVKAVGKKRLHLILFDFSLSRTPAESIRAGTRPYLDPFLSLRKPPRWDLHAERFAVAMTLYEMATGSLPRWGDGQSDPAMLNDEVTLDQDLFEADLRQPMTEFFQKALKRDVSERFDTCEEVLRAWRQIFEAGERKTVRDETSEGQLEKALEGITATTPLGSLPLSTRVLTAMDRLRVSTAAELLQTPISRVNRMQGVGTKTRGEIRSLVAELAKRLPAIEVGAAGDPELDEEDAEAPHGASVDFLQRKLLPAKQGRNEREIEALRGLTGLQEVPGAKEPDWPSQAEVALWLDVTRARVSQLVQKARERWAKSKPLNGLREEIAQILETNGGVMSASELTRAVLTSRGSSRVEPTRSMFARAIARAAIEAERERAEPRFFVRRAGSCVLIARTLDLADYAERLGKVADELATTDPLPGPARVQEALQRVRAPEGVALDSARLVRLAAAASAEAAVSSRLELYPRGMPPARALKLATGAVLGALQLSVDDLRGRVRARYPEAGDLPGRPVLDSLIKEAGWSLEWSSEKRTYVAPKLSFIPTESSTSTLGRHSIVAEAGEFYPEVGDARTFDEKLRHAIKNGAFLALTVRPSRLALAEQLLMKNFPVEYLSLEQLLLDSMRGVAAEKKVKWDVVLEADAAEPDSRSWQNLMALFRAALPRVRDRLSSGQRTLLLTHPGLLARYDALELVDFLRDRVYEREGLRGAWLLIPSDEQQTLPAIDGRPVPVISAGQWARIPDGWLKFNRDTAGAGTEASAP